MVDGRQLRELVLVRVRRHHGQRDVAGLVLDPVVVRRVRIPSEAEQLAVEVVGRFHVGHRHADVVDALDHGVEPSEYGA